MPRVLLSSPQILFELPTEPEPWQRRRLSGLCAFICGFKAKIPFHLEFLLGVRGQLGMICAMHFLREKFKSPIYVRVAPFFVFVGLIAFGGFFGKTGPFWVYAFRTFLGAYLLWEMRPFVPEMRWVISTEAIAIGVFVFIMWVGLDPYVPKNHIFFSPSPKDIAWNPFDVYGAGSTMGWFFITVRLLGSTFIVAPMEEVFWRSFLYRYCVNTNFESLPLKLFHPTSFIVVSFLFGIEHYEWVQGFLCGMAYQWLVISKNRLGDAIAAHAITNFLLGLWVVGRGAWHFW